MSNYKFQDENAELIFGGTEKFKIKKSSTNNSLTIINKRADLQLEESIKFEDSLTTILKPRNIFDSSKYLYVQGDEVFTTNKWYTCIKDTVLNTPITDTSYWIPKDNNINSLIGGIVFFAYSTAPSGYLKANGAAVSRVAYANLFAVIGTTFGAGNGTSTFNLPDLRGEFIRGWDDGRGVDTGRGFGSSQNDAIRNITGTFYDGDNAAGTGAFSSLTNTNGGYQRVAAQTRTRFDFDASRVVPTANENRPHNVALLACIKF